MASEPRLVIAASGCSDSDSDADTDSGMDAGEVEVGADAVPLRRGAAPRPASSSLPSDSGPVGEGDVLVTWPLLAATGSEPPVTSFSEDGRLPPRRFRIRRRCLDASAELPRYTWPRPEAASPVDVRGVDWSAEDVVLLVQLVGDVVILLVCVLEMPAWSAVLLLVLLRVAEQSSPERLGHLRFLGRRALSLFWGRAEADGARA